MTTDLKITINPVHLAAALGRVAFEEGRMCTPCLDKGFMAAMKAGSFRGNVLECLKAWTRAWTLANLAAPV